MTIFGVLLITLPYVVSFVAGSSGLDHGGVGVSVLDMAEIEESAAV